MYGGGFGKEMGETGADKSAGGIDKSTCIIKSTFILGGTQKMREEPGDADWKRVFLIRKSVSSIVGAEDSGADAVWDAGSVYLYIVISYPAPAWKGGAETDLSPRIPLAGDYDGGGVFVAYASAAGDLAAGHCVCQCGLPYFHAVGECGGHRDAAGTGESHSATD